MLNNYLSNFTNSKNNNPRIQELATKLHDYFCPYNHTDGCDWPYRDDWDEKWSAHKQYYEKAEILYNKYGEQSFDIVETLKEMKTLR